VRIQSPDLSVHRDAVKYVITIVYKYENCLSIESMPISHKLH